RRGNEAEAGVVVRVADDDDADRAERATALEAGVDQGRAYPAPLVVVEHGERREPHQLRIRILVDGHRGEQRVADDDPVLLGHERDARIGLCAELVDELGFTAGIEIGGNDLADGLPVLVFFVAYPHLGSSPSAPRAADEAESRAAI